MVNIFSLIFSNSTMKYWVQYVNQGVQWSSTSVVFSSSAEHHQLDTLTVHCSNYLNLVIFVQFVLNACSLKYDLMDILTFTQNVAKEYLHGSILNEFVPTFVVKK